MIRAGWRVLLLILAFAGTANAAGFDEISRQFLDSDFIFSRAQSDVPFVPLAWIDVNSYQDTPWRTTSGDGHGGSATE